MPTACKLGLYIVLYSSTYVRTNHSARWLGNDDDHNVNQNSNDSGDDDGDNYSCY